MTKSSKTRLDRKAKKVEASEIVPQSVVTFTELKNGGFTFAIGLHGARMEALVPGQSHTVSIVDVMTMAIAHLIKTDSPDLRAAVSHVHQVLRTTHDNIENGASVEEAMQRAAELDEEAQKEVAEATA